MPTINGKKVTTFRLLKGESENKDEIDWIQNFLTKYTKKMKKLHNKSNRSKKVLVYNRKKGQHRGSKSHSDLYTDEKIKTCSIKGLKRMKMMIRLSPKQKIKKVVSSLRKKTKDG